MRSFLVDISVYMSAIWIPLLVIVFAVELWGGSTQLQETTCAACLSEGGNIDVPSGDVIRVYDGDTITVRVASWPPIFSNMSFRLRGFDAPELRGGCERARALAGRAKRRLSRLIHEATTVSLRDIERGKYFRLVATVYADGIPVSLVLIDAGLARPYDGGARESWCD